MPPLVISSYRRYDSYHDVTMRASSAPRRMTRQKFSFATGLLFILLSSLGRIWASAFVAPSSTTTTTTTAAASHGRSSPLTLRMAGGALPPLDPTKLEIVLFGIGDLRVADHTGLTRAMSSGAQVLPLFLMDADTLSNIPGGASHVLDTEMMVASSLSSLATRLKDDVALDLHVYSSGAEDRMGLRDALQDVLGMVKKEQPSIDGITINVCDLRDADNGMGYGPYAYLQDGLDDASVTVQVRSWDCSLRSEPWSDLNALPTQYPTYENQYQIQSRAASHPEAMPERMATGMRHMTIPSLTQIPDSRAILDIICRSLDLDPECAETKKLLENERNTGLYGTHWGGMDGASLSETEVLAGLQAFESCSEDDDAFLNSKWWQARRLVRNGSSLEHAAINWMGRGDSDDAFASIKSTNLLKGEMMVRYLAAPLLFGTVSPRTVWHMASMTEGILDFIPLFKRRSVLRDVVEAREWHRCFAAKNIQSAEQGNHGPPAIGETRASYWRWHGFLCRYEEAIIAEGKGADVGTDAKKEGIVFVHGFGASGSQWSKAIKSLSKGLPLELIGNDKYEVVAPDLLGFGESEKPQLSFTQYLWESYVSSFVKEISVRKKKWDKFVIGGNSIGGYTAMSVAADDTVPLSDEIAGVNAVSASGAPGTNRCNGLVLMNSAGRILSKEEVDKTTGLDALVTVGAETAGDDLPKCRPPPRDVARIGGTGLLAYLRPRIQSICKNLYPTNPDAVDEILTGNILRDSLDPGAINVMISGSKLPPPRTANELLGADFGSARSHSKEDSSIIPAAEGMWEGRTLVAQGFLDPLNDAKTRARLLGELRKGITVQPINAGHCPHDELDEDVARAIGQWLLETTKKENEMGNDIRGIESSSIIIS